MTDALPVIRLKPKTDARALRWGAPWVYDNQIVTDRRTRALAPGALALLEDAGRAPVAVVAVNPGSRIFARVMDRDPTAVIDRDWLRARVARAFALRARLFDAPFYRLIHAEGDGLSGVIVDRFGDLAVLQPNAAWAERMCDDLVQVIADVTGVRNVIVNGMGRGRALEGLPECHELALGVAPDAPIPVPMNGATYMADVMGGQKTGLFFDQRPNHRFVAGLARDARVLDVFSHVGGFALAALAGGAQSALAIDGSQAALELAEAGARAMQVADRFETRKGDAFAQMEALAQSEARYDIVICDPPAFAPSKQALSAGLRAYEKTARLGAALVAEGGILVLCSCSHAADLDKFRAACLRGIGRAGRTGALIRTGFAGPDHPVHPQLAENGYLKSLSFAL